MSILLILLQLFHSAAAETNKPYESYEEIVERLSSYRSQKISTEMSTSIPRERFHVAFGLTNTSTRISDFGMGSVSHTGFSLGAALPLIEQQLFFEAGAKFYNGVDNGNLSSSLQQFEAKINHKEALNFAILNVGAGVSTRLLSLTTPDTEINYRIPSLLISTGLERRINQSMSFGGELGFHRSMKNDPNGRNTVELALKLNYHL